MFNRVRRLFSRYANRHLDVNLGGVALHDHQANIVGYIDRVRLCHNGITITGWTIAPQVTIESGGTNCEISPSILRSDILSGLGDTAQGNLGFEHTLPHKGDAIILSVELGGREYVYQMPSPRQRDVTLAKLRLVPSFGYALIKASPSIIRWLFQRNPAAKAKVKSILGLSETANSTALVSDYFSPNTSPVPSPSKITIILPIYNAFDLLEEVLERVKNNTDAPWRLIIVEDCSPDERVRPFIRNWVEQENGEVLLLENESNKGFIGSVNKALKQAKTYGDHVVLLNSDALVPADWASRLMAPILQNKDVATVTPMSNDAEIFSVPVICHRTQLVPGQGDAIDAFAQTLNAAADDCQLPTGVGFCMAMNTAYLAKIPALDTAFGRGYGEEVDWCQKARALGGRHVAQPSLFVEHRGGASFGSAEKLKLVMDNNKIISQRYPEYDQQVQDFISLDPLLTPRLALAIAWVASLNDNPVPVFVAHSLGGGAEHYLQRRIDDDLERDQPSIVLRVGGLRRWQIEIHSQEGLITGSTDDTEILAALFAPIRPRHIVYSCGVGGQDPAELPDVLLSLWRKGQDQIEILMHDFFPLSPSYCLLGDDGRFAGAAALNPADHVSQFVRPDGTKVSLADWQKGWGRLLAAANEIVTFSNDSKDHVLAVYPDLTDTIVVRPHTLPHPLPKLKPPKSKKVVIGVLGNIGHQKGAGVIADLGKALKGNDAMSVIIVGDVDPGSPMPSTVTVLGQYRISDIPNIAARHGISCWLIPSIWPETFSYTTHEALSTGLPVYCFDLGAQAEAVKKAGNGTIIPFKQDQVQGIINAVLTNGAPKE